jgi:hypothetical protein
VGVDPEKIGLGFIDYGMKVNPTSRVPWGKDSIEEPCCSVMKYVYQHSGSCTA